MNQDHTFQLGGRVFDLESGRAGGAGGEHTTITQAVDALRKEFADRQGLRLTFIRLERAEQKQAQVIAWRSPVGLFTLQTQDQFGVSHTSYTNTVDLFNALESHAAMCAIQWDTDVQT